MLLYLRNVNALALEVVDSTLRAISVMYGTVADVHVDMPFLRRVYKVVPMMAPINAGEMVRGSSEVKGVNMDTQTSRSSSDDKREFYLCASKQG